MNNLMNVKELEAQEKRLQDEVVNLRERINRIQEACKHEWGAMQYTPDVREAYTIPGDATGTMGVDWRGPCYVNRKETPKWTRVCLVCNKTEVTTRIHKEVKEVPIW